MYSGDRFLKSSPSVYAFDKISQDMFECKNEMNCSICPDNRGDGSVPPVTWNEEYSQRLAIFMKNSKTLLENIDKKHQNKMADIILNKNNFKTQTVSSNSDDLEENKLHLDEIQYVFKKDDLQKSKKDNKNPIRNMKTLENKVEKENRKDCVNKKHDFQEGLRIDDLESQLVKLKNQLVEKDEKIQLLKSEIECKSNPVKISHRNLVTEFNNQTSSSCNISEDKELINSSVLKDRKSNYHLPSFEISKKKSIDDSSNKNNNVNSANNFDNKVKAIPNNPIQFNESRHYVSSIKDYNPNNPVALQNKIKDLECQIQDLQEANEIASQFVLNTKDSQCVESKGGIISDLIMKNQFLREEVEKLRQDIELLNGEAVSTTFLRTEIEGLKEDLFYLKQQNNMIVNENAKLKNLIKRSAVNSEDERNDFNNTDIDNNIQLNNELYFYSNTESNKAENESEKSSNLLKHGKSYSKITSNEQFKEKLPKHKRKYDKRQDEQLPYSVNNKITVDTKNEIENDELLMGVKPKMKDNDICLYDEIRKKFSNDSTDSMLSDMNKETGELNLFNSIGKFDKSRSSSQQRNEFSQDFKETLFNVNYFDESDLPNHEKFPINKFNIKNYVESASDNKFSTFGRTAFAPRSGLDICINDIVKFIRQGGQISKGLVHFIGHLPNRNDIYLGIELEVEDGKHDGIYEGKRYFQCRTNKGVFVAFNKVIMVYSKKLS